MIKIKTVKSSNIEAIGYDNDSQELHVIFISGGLYIYHGVSKNVYDKLIIAPSKGKFIHNNIKGIYGFTKK